MIYGNVELHNVAEVREIPERPGVRLQRVPEDVRSALNPGAQERMLSPANAEIRFVTSSETVDVTVAAPVGAAELQPFWGCFQGSQRLQVANGEKTFTLSYPERLRELTDDADAGMPFSRNVWRLVLRGGPLHVVKVEGTDVRPPTRDECPALRLLTYGTSITHGAAATGIHLTYAAQTAWRLGADLINLGVGGAAYCEKELADYMAARDDWDIATLALSVNMIGAGFTCDQFRDRVNHMVNTVAGANTARPVACITLYPHFRDSHVCPGITNPGWKARPDQFRSILRDVVEACPHPNVHLIEGPDMLRDLWGLSVDLIHPADNGMIQMGEVLAARLRGILDNRTR